MDAGARACREKRQVQRAKPGQQHQRPGHCAGPRAHAAAPRARHPRQRGTAKRQHRHTGHRPLGKAQKHKGRGMQRPQPRGPRCPLAPEQHRAGGKKGCQQAQAKAHAIDVRKHMIDAEVPERAAAVFKHLPQPRAAAQKHKAQKQARLFDTAIVQNAAKVPQHGNCEQNARQRKQRSLDIIARSTGGHGKAGC